MDVDAEASRKRPWEGTDAEARQEIASLEQEKRSIAYSFKDLEKYVQNTEAKIKLIRGELEQSSLWEDAKPEVSVKLEGGYRESRTDKPSNEGELRRLRKKNVELLKALAEAGQTTEQARQDAKKAALASAPSVQATPCDVKSSAMELLRLLQPTSPDSNSFVVTIRPEKQADSVMDLMNRGKKPDNFTLEVDEYETIDVLECKIWLLLGVVPGEQKLLYDRRRLEGHGTLRSYGITRPAVIMLMLR